MDKLEKLAQRKQAEEASTSATPDDPDVGTGRGHKGKYRQYEEPHVIMQKIRDYRTQRYPDSEIMKLMDNMPRRTFYNYVKKILAEDKEIVDGWIEQHVEQVAEDLMIFRESMNKTLREVEKIIEDSQTSAREKLRAIAMYVELSEKLMNKEPLTEMRGARHAHDVRFA
jgi:hypothetical protein